jgi:hypothetical protein
MRLYHTEWNIVIGDLFYTELALLFVTKFNGNTWVKTSTIFIFSVLMIMNHMLKIYNKFLLAQLRVLVHRDGSSRN